MERFYSIKKKKKWNCLFVWWSSSSFRQSLSAWLLVELDEDMPRECFPPVENSLPGRSFVSCFDWLIIRRWKARTHRSCQWRLNAPHHEGKDRHKHSFYMKSVLRGIEVFEGTRRSTCDCERGDGELLFVDRNLLEDNGTDGESVEWLIFVVGRLDI